MRHRYFSRTARAFSITALILAMTAGPTLAATRTWDGGSNVNGNWTTPANWDNNIAPAAGDDLVFTTSPRSQSINDFAAGTTFNSVTMALGNHQLTGNGIALNAGVHVTGGGFFQLASIKLNNGQTFSTLSGTGGSISSAVNNNGNALTVDGAGTLQFSGVISGSGGLVKNGSGRLDLFGAASNTYSGDTRINDGLVQLYKDAGRKAVVGPVIIGDNVGAANSALVKLLNSSQGVQQVTINADGQFDLNGFTTVAQATINGGNLTIGGGTFSTLGDPIMTGGSISSTGAGKFRNQGDFFITKPAANPATVSGILDLGSGVLTFNVGDGGFGGYDLEISAVIIDFNGTAGLTKTGPGRMRLTANNTYGWDTTVSQGELRVDGEQPQSAVIVNGGTLSGVGTVGAVTADSGLIAPSPGGAATYLLNIQGNLKLGPASTYLFTYSPSVPGLAVVVGEVDLGSSTLELDVTSIPSNQADARGDLVIIDNDGTDPIIGAFNGLPEGSWFDQNGRTFYISYQGGDGNDVASYTPGTWRWSGAGPDNNWTTGANWVLGTPQPREKLVFPADAARLSNTNNFPAGTEFHSVTITGSGYNLGGNLVLLDAGITDTGASGTANEIGIPLKLNAEQTFRSDGTQRKISLSGSIDTNAHSLALDGTGSVNFSGIISGSGSVRRQGSGETILSADNLYTGATICESGRLIINGSQPQSAVQLSGGTLGGTGFVGPLFATGGTISPGGVDAIAVSAGIMDVVGDLTLGTASTYRADLRGSSAGQYDRLKVTGAVNLANATLAAAAVLFTAAVGDSFLIVSNDGTDPVNGTFANLIEGAVFKSGSSVFSITYQGGDGNDVVLTTVDPNINPSPTPTPTPTPGMVANVSTRLRVGTGDNALIEGFIVQGPAGSSKKILVRAIGPSLIPFGITDAVSDPTLEIFDANNVKIASNDDWKTTQVGGIIGGDQFAEINGSGLAPSNDVESAIVANLAPGSYTAVVRGAGNTVGTGVVDAFDLGAASPARLANIATRGLIQPGDKLMIAGFIVQTASVQAVIRAVGPSLAPFGITDALPDTTLELHDENGTIVGQNDDWMSDQKTELESTGLQPSHNLEAALLKTLAPGAYTVQVRGKPEATGTGVVQIYFLQ